MAIGRLKQKVAHQLLIAQDNILQYVQYRTYGNYSKATPDIETPDMWIEAYNMETAAKIALSTESKTGDELPMEIECITELKSSTTSTAAATEAAETTTAPTAPTKKAHEHNKGKPQIIMNDTRKRFKEMRPFVPLQNKENNAELNVDNQKQMQTM